MISQVRHIKREDHGGAHRDFEFNQVLQEITKIMERKVGIRRGSQRNRDGGATLEAGSPLHTYRVLSAECVKQICNQPLKLILCIIVWLQCHCTRISYMQRLERQTD